jgi:hypothetical protein
MPLPLLVVVVVVVVVLLLLASPLPTIDRGDRIGGGSGAGYIGGGGVLFELLTTVVAVVQLPGVVWYELVAEVAVGVLLVVVVAVVETIIGSTSSIGWCSFTGGR